MKSFIIFEFKKQTKKTKNMENTIKEQRQKDIFHLEREIKEMKETLKNSKDYLKYMKDCLKEIEEEEQKEKETPEQRECQILFNKWVQGDL
jgi:septal ring factor EnvC (AmiA/AmiB activator)